jgi:hypothetical protein
MTVVPEWNQHCSDLAARNIKAIAHRDVWAELGGCPRSWEDAAALYRRLGVRTLYGAVTAVLGPSIDPKQAMRGDIVMVDNALGICRGERAEFLDGMHPMGRATAAWRVMGKG